MGMIFGICAVMVLATFAPEIFAATVVAFRNIINKLKSLWSSMSSR
jgi:hypothetical protein